MNNKLKDILHSFKGKVVGTPFMKLHITKTLAVFPEGVINFVTNNCWFMGSMENAWAFTFTGNDLKDKHLIFLSDDLLNQDEAQIHWSIAHEIGHVILKHRNSTLIRQSREEIHQQEYEADEFARKYLHKDL